MSLPPPSQTFTRTSPEDLNQPTLVINDGLDNLTPAYQSRQSTHRGPNAQYLQTTFGTHSVLMERPGGVLRAAPDHT